MIGYIVRCPLGGMAWHHAQYLVGLRELGHQVVFIEDSDDVPWSCYDPTRGVTDSNPTYGLAFTERFLGTLGVDRWAYFDTHGERWHGPSASHALRLCGEADLVVNVSLANPLRPWFDAVERRIAIDTDPVFTQVQTHPDPTRRERTAAPPGSTPSPRRWLAATMTSRRTALSGGRRGSPYASTYGLSPLSPPPPPASRP